MARFKNTSKLTPMSVNYRGETYIIPPGKELVLDEPVEENTVQVPSNFVGPVVVEEEPKAAKETPVGHTDTGAEAPSGEGKKSKSAKKRKKE